MSYIKAAAMAGAIAAGGIMGMKKGDVIKLRYEELLYLKRIFLLIRGELRYHCGVINEVFRNVGEKVREPYRNAFLNMADDIEQCIGSSFPEIWEKNVVEEVKKTELSDTDIEDIRELGHGIGFLDMEMQLNNIDYYLERLEEKITDTKEGMDSSIKLFKTLGIMGGLLAAILML